MFASDEIERRVKQKPFIPMRIIMSAGDSYDVYHPDMIMVGRRIVVVGTASEQKPSQFDKVTQLSILHLAAIDNLPSEAATGANGSA